MSYYLRKEETRLVDNHYLSLDTENWFSIPEHQYLKLSLGRVFHLIKCSEGTAIRISAELPKSFMAMCKGNPCTKNHNPATPDPIEQLRQNFKEYCPDEYTEILQELGDLKSLADEYIIPPSYESGVLTENLNPTTLKPTTPTGADFDYAIMYVEERLGTGAVMEMMDYIEDKKRNEEESVGE